MEKRGQASFEMMLVIAFAILFTTGLIYAFSNQIFRQSSEVEMAQIERFGNSLIESINKLSYMGETSSLAFEQSLPANVVNITLDRSPTSVSNRTIIFWHKDSTGAVSPIVFYSPVDIALDFTNPNKGAKKIILTSSGNNILVCLKTESYNCNGICDYDSGENAYNAPSDCCGSDCRACMEQKRLSQCDTWDPLSNCIPICYGHNGCQEVC